MSSIDILEIECRRVLGEDRGGLTWLSDTDAKISNVYLSESTLSKIFHVESILG